MNEKISTCVRFQLNLFFIVVIVIVVVFFSLSLSLSFPPSIVSFNSNFFSFFHFVCVFFIFLFYMDFTVSASCRYEKSQWTECNPETNVRTRTLSLKKGDEGCIQTRTIQKKCKKGKHTCMYV